MIRDMKGIIAVYLLASMTVQAQSPDSIWARSLKKYERQDYNGVVEDMNLLLKSNSGFAEAYYNRGIARLNLGDMDGACYDLQIAQEKGTDENRRYVSYLCNQEIIRDLVIKQSYNKQKVYADRGFRPKYTRADTLRGALRPERTCYDVYFYNLDVKILPKHKRITGRNSIYFHVVQSARTLQVDLFDNFTITGITWNGMSLPHKRIYNAIFITFPRELEKGENLVLEISYRGRPVKAPNPPWDGGFVWDRDKNKNLWLGVACEHLGASSWWPNKDHLTDKPDSMLIQLEVPRGYQAVANGNLRQVDAAGKKYDRFSWFVSYPINNYNVTFYVGKYAAFNDTLIQGTDTVRFDYNVLDYNLDIAREHFRQTRDVIGFYNKAFGMYPFLHDGFALVESPYEGMEHQSAIAYGNEYNRNNNSNVNEFRNRIYDYIIVHEAAHEWWGNSVTASDMADIWIHEGFATFAELMFLENRFSRDEYLYELSEKCRYIFNIWPMVQNRDVNENTFAGNDVYNKAAMMLHCLRCSLDDDSLFFELIRSFCLKYRYHTVTTKDFIDFSNQYSGKDFSAFFRKYLYDIRLPVLTYTYQREDGDILLKYRWTGVEDGFIMPFAIATDRKKSFRLVAGTTWQETRLSGTSWFNFYNLYTGYQGCPVNAFTYYNTVCTNPQ